MVKKRKTPSEPRRGTSASSSGILVIADRDTDEQDLGALHGFDDGATQTSLPTFANVELDESLFREAEPIDPAAEGEYSGLSISSGAPKSEEDRRLTLTLFKIFARRRVEINLSVDQLARLSGVALATLRAFEEGMPGQVITYDQAVVLARVLGVAPEELPGLRRRDERAHLGLTLSELERTLHAAPLLRFEGAHGERYGGDVERVAASKAFAVRVEDESLTPALPRGAMLGFMAGVRPRPGATLLLRHRRSALLAMRRHAPPAYVGLATWQPSYVIGGEWHVIGSLEVILPPR